MLVLSRNRTTYTFSQSQEIVIIGMLTSQFYDAGMWYTNLIKLWSVNPYYNMGRLKPAHRGTHHASIQEPSQKF